MRVIGVGNALLDVLLNLESDAILKEIGIKKATMDLIDELKMKEIQLAQSGLQRTEAPGGSVCNTMRAMARLGGDVGYIGKIGDDSYGDIYKKEIIKAGVNPFLVYTRGISGCSTVLISPDGERTMATFLGPAATLTHHEIPDGLLNDYDLIYIEGYLISNENLFIPILERAKERGIKIALDLSNYNIVNGFKGLLKDVVPGYVDILFSNESEAEAYTGLKARDAIGVIAQEVEISVVTIGKEGVLAAKDNNIIHHKALESKVVDTTGAGDNFAAGFLYGYSRDATIEQCAAIGSLLSGNVIETIGAQITEDKWEQIKLKVADVLRK
jgi:sugar/nucleoside kinase (ribokinase family)